MKIGDILYFAPKVCFNQVDLSSPALPDIFSRRIMGFYLEPAQNCVERDQAFAAGILLVCTIDAMARFRYGVDQTVGNRFRKFAKEELASFASDGLAGKFYDQFRNGLLHESRLKSGAQFSLDTSCTVEQVSELVLINPAHLLAEVRKALDDYVRLLNSDEGELIKLVAILGKDHRADFRVANS